MLLCRPIGDTPSILWLTCLQIFSLQCGQVVSGVEKIGMICFLARCHQKATSKADDDNLLLLLLGKGRQYLLHRLSDGQCSKSYENSDKLYTISQSINQSV